MADERNTPFNQVFPKLVQLTDEGLLETGDGRPDPQQMLGDKGSLTLSHVDRGGAYNTAVVNDLSRQTVVYARNQSVVHVWGTVRPNGSSNSITVGSYWGLSGLPYPAKTFRGGLVAGRVIILTTDQDFLGGFGNGVVAIGGPDLFRFIITDSGAQTFRNHHFQFSYIIDDEA